MPPKSHQPATRSNLSDALADRLRDMLVDGEIEAGSRLNEVHLAATMGVSRTPLREALAGLAAEGYVEVQPRRGFFARDLSRAELEQLYPLRAILDVAALEMAGIPSAEQLDRLDAINARLKAGPTTVARIIDLDDEWHRTLLQHCPNTELLSMVDQSILKTRRYEHAYMRQVENVRVATEEHDAVADALRAENLVAAGNALRINLSSGLEAIVEWLESRAAQ